MRLFHSVLYSALYAVLNSVLLRCIPCQLNWSTSVTFLWSTEPLSLRASSTVSLWPTGPLVNGSTLQLSQILHTAGFEIGSRDTSENKIYGLRQGRALRAADGVIDLGKHRLGDGAREPRIHGPEA